MGGAVALLACCFVFILLLPVILFGFTYIFRVSCKLCGLPKPGVLNAAGIMFVSWVCLFIAETILRLVVWEAGQAAGMPRWESGIITFFLALPIDLLISSSLHAILMGIRFGKSVEVWYVQRLIQLSILAAIAFVAAIVYLAQNGN